MSETKCTCRKGAWDPECPKHGRRRVLPLLPALACLFIAALAIATAPAEGRELQPVGLTICEVFGDRYCGQALRVAWCESRLDTDARNGQYRGLFQMGRWERSRYGHGRTARAQARAAERYFIASGRDWSPWECQP